MVKSYLKYEHIDSLALISSGTSNVLWAEEPRGGASIRATGAGRAITGAGEDVLCWDIKKGELLSRWNDKTCHVEVTTIARSPADPEVYAVGYADGSIRLWDSRMSTVIITFNGHKSAVTALAFDLHGVRLASGSQDTDIIVWDLIAETGLFKLKGHTNQVTGLHFLNVRTTVAAGTSINIIEDQDNTKDDRASNSLFEVLLSTGKDSFLKLWDLDVQHCLETHIVQSNGECWSFSVSPTGDGCVTAGNEGELKFWTIDIVKLRDAILKDSGAVGNCIIERGVIFRHSKDRTINIKFHPSLAYIAAHGSEKLVEIFRIRSENEVRKSIARKRKRQREKANKNANKGDVDAVEGRERLEDDLRKINISEFIVSYLHIRTTGKVRSLDWADGRMTGKALRILIATANNQIEMFETKTLHKDDKKSKSEEQPEYSRSLAVDIPGHRTDVRSLSLSSDDRMLASASNGSLKVWNVRTKACLRSLDCGYALCSSFLPGDKIVAVGNRNGEIELFDISSSALIETIKAHDGPVWTLHVHPNGRSMITGSADKSAKFWDFEIVQEEVPGSKRKTSRLSLVHSRTLKVNDDILNVRFSPDGKLLAVATLDNTVKVFFEESLKMFLNLYGHKLPVLSMDISYDNKMIVTCSADKNIRLWGLDFGDCHKAFFAHQDSIMQVAFVPHNQDDNGHHFFSASKDRTIKYWDGAKFEQIQKLNGHHGEIWAVAVSRTGDFIASASHDKSIRIWQQTDEQIFLEEERERELEELYESTLVATLGDEQGDPQDETATASKQTVETLMAGEKIAEALDLGLEDQRLVSEWRVQKSSQPDLAPPQRNIMFLAHGNISAEQYVLSALEKIKVAALQDALLVLTFDHVRTLFAFLGVWADRQWNIPLVCRVLFFLLKTHHRQIIASKTLRPMLSVIRSRLRQALNTQKNEIGYNMAALQILRNQIQERSSKHYVDESWASENPENKAKKRSFVNIG